VIDTADETTDETADETADEATDEMLCGAAEETGEQGSDTVEPDDGEKTEAAGFDRSRATCPGRRSRSKVGAGYLTEWGQGKDGSWWGRGTCEWREWRGARELATAAPKVPAPPARCSRRGRDNNPKVVLVNDLTAPRA
jgi:hypothetical protein